MANNTANVSTGKPKIAGAVYRAPLGTTIPTDSVTALDAAFVALGYVSEDGVTNANDSDTTEIKAWGGDTVYTTHEDVTDTFEMTFIEAMNEEVLKAYFGDDNVTGALATGITITANRTDPVNSIWVIDMILNGNATKRIVIPNGAVTGRGEISYVDSEVIGYNVTITAQPDASGNTHYEYIKAA